MNSNYQLQEQRQEISLTPELIKSMELLQMPLLDLADYINNAAEENPAIELEQTFTGELRRLERKVSRMDSMPGKTIRVGAEDYDETEFGDPANELEGLPFFLRSQIKASAMDKRQRALLNYLINLLDENGYLAQEDLDHLEELGVPGRMVEEALRILQNLEPAGVGARDISECLLLQLERLGEGESVAAAVAAYCLDELAKKQYSRIAKKIGVKIPEIEEAERLIRKLEPNPGKSFSREERAQYIVPDVYVVKVDDQWQVVLNDSYLPRVSVSDYYVKLFNATEEEEVKQYLREKLRNAKWLINCIEHRERSLKRCAEEILSRQRGWFEGETKELQPMTLSELAELLDVNVSTVSRAVKRKYLQCSFGTFPMSFFFTHAVGFVGVSEQAIKQRILALIKQEDPRHPLSDRRISELLLFEDVIVARRTVTKYREEIKIGSTRVRRRR